MKNSLNILFIGDIVGRPGRRAVEKVLPKLKEEEGIDFVIANGENLAAGKGMTYDKYSEMIEAGVDYFTSGNHIWNNRDIISYLKEDKVKVLRPANYPDDSPGHGYATVKVKGIDITIMNLMGRVFLPILVNDPFEKANEIVSQIKDSIIIVDIHAEATSEKIALAHYLDGRVGAVLGSHTHVQTSDEMILPKGTAFISDAGMTGPSAKESVLGVEKEIILKQFLTGLPQSHKVASGEAIFNAALVSFDVKTRKALSIKRIFETIET